MVLPDCETIWTFLTGNFNLNFPFFFQSVQLQVITVSILDITVEHTILHHLLLLYEVLKGMNPNQVHQRTELILLQMNQKSCLQTK